MTQTCGQRQNRYPSARRSESPVEIDQVNDSVEFRNFARSWDILKRPQFDGEDRATPITKISKYLRDLHDVLRFSHVIGELDWYTAVRYTLRCEARDYFEEWSRPYRSEVPMPFALWEHAFKKRFFPVDWREVALREIENLDYRSIGLDKLLDEFRRLVLLWAPEQRDHDLFRVHFQRILPRRMAVDLHNSNLDNDDWKILDAIEWARLYRYEEEDREKNRPNKRPTDEADDKRKRRRFSGDCSYCGIKGHKAVQCSKRKNDVKREQQSSPKN